LTSLMNQGEKRLEISDAQEKIDLIQKEIQKVIIGHTDALELLVITALSGGHILLEGIPGLGKTTLAKAFAGVIGSGFKRIQMTPDMLPADVLGVNVYNPYDGTWALRRGPIFTNILMVDELNRASPKVQSAFLEVMQEMQVTIEGETLRISKPFIVIGTQVPYGEPGTYPLTNVQIDRFAYRMLLEPPETSEEEELLSRIDAIDDTIVEPIISTEELIALSALKEKVHVEPVIHEYIVSLVQSLRGNEYIRSGPSPRASIWLYKGSRARALIEGREYVIPDDVKMMARYVLPHRLTLDRRTILEDVSSTSLIDDVLKETPVPR